MKRSILLITVCFAVTVFLCFCVRSGIARLVCARESAAEAERLSQSLLSPYTAEAELMRLYGEADLALYQGRDPAALEGISRSGNSFLLTASGLSGLMQAELRLTAITSGTRCALEKIGLVSSGIS